MPTDPPEPTSPTDSERRRDDAEAELEYQRRIALEDPTEWEPKRHPIPSPPPEDLSEGDVPRGRRKPWYRRRLFWVPVAIVAILGGFVARGYALASEFSACLADDRIHDQVSEELHPYWLDVLRERWGITPDTLEEAFDAMSDEDLAKFTEFMGGGSFATLGEARTREICTQIACTDTLRLSGYAPGRFLYRTLHPDSEQCP